MPHASTSRGPEREQERLDHRRVVARRPHLAVARLELRVGVEDGGAHAAKLRDAAAAAHREALPILARSPPRAPGVVGIEVADLRHGALAERDGDVGQPGAALEHGLVELVRLAAGGAGASAASTPSNASPSTSRDHPTVEPPAPSSESAVNPPKSPRAVRPSLSWGLTSRWLLRCLDASPPERSLAGATYAQRTCPAPTSVKANLSGADLVKADPVRRQPRRGPTCPAPNLDEANLSGAKPRRGEPVRRQTSSGRTCPAPTSTRRTCPAPSSTGRTCPAPTSTRPNLSGAKLSRGGPVPRLPRRGEPVGRRPLQDGPDRRQERDG